MLKETQVDEILSLYPVLLDLPVALRKALTAEGNLLKLGSGEVLFDAGSPCNQFLLVTRGSLRVVKTGLNGREAVLYRVQVGQVCPLTLICLLNNASYTAKSIVEAETEAVGIPRNLLLSMLDESTPVRLFVLRAMAERMLGMIGLVEELLFGRLDQRLALLLLARGRTVQITHQGLADELGSTREAISRTLESLEEQGLIGLERGRITILDRSGMGKIARNVR